MNRFADDRVTGSHTKITAIDCSCRLEADPLACVRKFAVDLNTEADRPGDAEQSKIAGNLGMSPIDPFDASGDERNIRIIGDVEKRLAAQKVIQGGRTGFD